MEIETGQNKILTTPPIDPIEAQEGLREASTYWTALRELFPMMILGGVASFFWNLKQIINERTWSRRAIMFVSVVGLGSISGLVGVAGIELFIPTISPKGAIVAGVISGIFWQKTFDAYGRKLFGWKTRQEDKENIERYSDRGGKWQD